MSGRSTMVVWTALPNGIVGGVARVSVFATPKLYGEGGTIARLGNYPEILAWPTTTSGIRFRILSEVDGEGGTIDRVAYPSNRGELSCDASLWAALFDGSIRVDVQGAVAEDLPRGRRIPIYYRIGPLQALIEETYALEGRLALSDVENEPKRPRLLGTLQYDTPNALFGLAGSSSPAITARQFATLENGRYEHKLAASVSAFFSSDDLKDKRHGLVRELHQPWARKEVSELFSAFSLYHRRGVRNKLHRLRARRRWANKDPNFNFLDTAAVQIGRSDNGKEFEFAESNINVVLPNLLPADKGYQVTVAYSPDESLPAPSNDGDRIQATLRAQDEAVPRYSDYLRIRAGAGRTFVSGAGYADVPAQRSRRFFWDGTNWVALDSNDLDFHALLSALGAYPYLLRRLGWIVDLEFRVEDLFPTFRSGVPFSGRIKVQPLWSGSASTTLQINSPWTLFSVGERFGATDQGISLVSFNARSDPGRPRERFVAGFRDLSNTSSYQYDVDAAVIKVAQKAIRDADQTNRYLRPHRIELRGSPRAAVMNLPTRGQAADFLDHVIEIDGEQRWPAIRSTGLSLYADTEYLNFAKALQANAKREQAAAVSNSGDSIYSNDVTSGLVIDVYDKTTNRWQSLCERQVLFSSGSHPDFLAPADEGWISAEAASETDESGNTQERISENFFRWDGWSLVAPNPSKALEECNSGPDHSLPRNVDLKAQVEVKFDGLPRLRFGHEYRFRARVADLAGNSWHPDYADSLGVTNLVSKPVTYHRFDPINPPFFIPLQPPGPGSPVETTGGSPQAAARGPEKGEMLVVRSGIGIAARSGQWLVLPPEVKIQEAQWIGMLDAFAKPDHAFAILERYCETLPAGYDPTFVRRITWPGGRLATPYIPDGHAAGAALRYLPGKERQPVPAGTAATRSQSARSCTTLIDFALDLEGPARRARPFSQPVYLRLKGGKVRKTSYAKAARRLTVVLPPGEQQLIRVGCTPPIGALNMFGQVDLAFNARQETFLVQPRTPAALGRADSKTVRQFGAELREAVQAGLFWPLTPQKNLYLVHAVPKPIIPSPKDPRQRRALQFSADMAVSKRPTGGKAVVLHDPTLRVHRASTGRIDTYAKWTEYLDAPGMKWPSTLRQNQKCFSEDIELPDLTIAPDDSHLTVDFGQRHEFPTTKHYAVRYNMVATTRYREYYDPAFVAKADNITVKSLDSPVFHILNTVPPPQPDIVYVLPILIWDDPETTRTTTLRRVRRGLRVYMRRNWFASGEDERLGVVFTSRGVHQNSPNDPTLDASVPVTEWGTNPIWATRALGGQPTTNEIVADAAMVFSRVAIAKQSVSSALANRRDATMAPTGVVVPSISDRRRSDDQIVIPDDGCVFVDVAALDVKLDSDKDLIYADVEFKETGSYSFMVSMALARFQPFSAPYAHLSSVTRWVFQAISPERTVTYGVVSETVGDELQPSRQLRFTLGGVGPGDRKQGFLRNTVEVALTSDKRTDPSHQIPLIADEDTLMFRIPVRMLQRLRRPVVHISEFEHFGATDRRLFVAHRIELDARLWR